MTPALAAVPHPDNSPPVPTDRARSIQGEAANAHRDHLYASQGYVDQYAKQVSDGVATCRERFRHRYPPLPRSAPFEERPTPGGFLVRETEPCLDCGCAIQVQRYESRFEGKGRNRTLRVRPAYSTVRYIENEYGETYTVRDHGFIRPKDFRESLATMAVMTDPHSQALAAAAARTRAEVLARREERAAERD